MFRTALYGALILFLAGWFQNASAQSKADGGITLIGRGDKVKVVDKSGKTQNVDTKTLRVNSATASTDRSTAPAAKTDGKNPAKDDAKDKDTKDAKKDDAPAKDAPAAETSSAPEEDPKKKAAREKEEADKKKAEKEKLRGLVNQGAWLYDASGKPLSSEDVMKRIEAGDIGGIRTVDLHQQPWQTSPDKPADKDKAAGSKTPADKKNTGTGNSSKKAESASEKAETPVETPSEQEK